ncbi:unnamed protein product [Rotaria sordida]|uniref:Uncharacterized protein n=2 Tax=Rotaria sordida TaxID=392033 RepID=A0A815IDK3_9BILA|nr:unnamed protein product [Rotaria sordida]
MATTTMITSTPMEDKKKTSSANKHNRSTVARTLKHNPKYELKKDELRHEHVKEDILNEQIPMNNVYETQPVQLEEVIIQQRKQIYFKEKFQLRNELDNIKLDN